MSTAAQIARFIRWKEWAPPTFNLVWVLGLYIAVAYDLPVDRFALTFVVFFIFAFTQAALAYLVNDWGDRRIDRRQFKSNAFNGLSPLESALALTLVVIVAFIAGTPLIYHTGFAVLWVTWAVIMAAYSLPPLRLKTRGVVGIAACITAQWFLPVLLAFSAFDVAGGADMWILAVAFSLHGISLLIRHQRKNHLRQVHARANTLGATLSTEQLTRLYGLSLLVDKIAVGVLVVTAALALRSMDLLAARLLAACLAAAYAFSLFKTFGPAIMALRAGDVIDPHRRGAGTMPRLAHRRLLDLILPLALGLGAALRLPLYGLFLCMYILGSVIWLGVEWSLPGSMQTLAEVFIRRGGSRSR